MNAEEISISTDASKIDLEFVHNYLCNTAYWAKGRSKADVKTSIESSLCFSLFSVETKKQIGFARVATDYVVFAWIMDVFIDDNFKGKGYGKKLVNFVLNHPELQSVNGFGLRTSDAHGLYRQFGFTEVPDPDTWMYKNNKK
ncbi:MAG: GNAT family N-acetyltransferase [Kangiellaceae bacterium]|jgi:GNAT superfamily N-acetyltransferase|nr:GNAT family N-acetyltransferase [Kangiellaceae bacterium]